MAHNVLGTELESCSTAPLTGFYRNGCRDTGAEHSGAAHVATRAWVGEAARRALAVAPGSGSADGPTR